MLEFVNQNQRRIFLSLFLGLYLGRRREMYETYTIDELLSMMTRRDVVVVRTGNVLHAVVRSRHGRMVIVLPVFSRQFCPGQYAIVQTCSNRLGKRVR